MTFEFLDKEKYKVLKYFLDYANKSDFLREGKNTCMAVYKRYGETFRKLRKQRGFKLTSFEDL